MRLFEVIFSLDKSGSDKYPDDWSERRKAVYKRDGYKCAKCGKRGGWFGNAELHAHHKTKISNGGSHDLSNLQTLCRECHVKVEPHLKNFTSTKQDLSIYSFIETIPILGGNKRDVEIGFKFLKWIFFGWLLLPLQIIEISSKFNPAGVLKWILFGWILMPLKILQKIF